MDRLKGSAMAMAVAAALILAPGTASAAIAPQVVRLVCPAVGGGLRAGTRSSVEPGVILADTSVAPATYSADTIDGNGQVEVIGAPSTRLTTDHLVAAWLNGANCTGLSTTRNAWVVDSGGLVTGEDDKPGAPAANFGDMSGQPINRPVVGMSPTADGEGYWLVAADGGIFAFGNARYYGSTGAMTLNKPIVGMAVTPDGAGYWLVASDGGIFTFGDAQFYGSTGNLDLDDPIVAMLATPDGHGYWMVASDGGVFAFGDAQFYGSTGGRILPAPIAGMIPVGNGYTLVGQAGGLYPFPATAPSPD
jgi:hypothetical protein